MSEDTDITVVASALFKLLKPLQSEDRSRVVRAAFALLDDSPKLAPPAETPVGIADVTEEDGSLHSKARAWMTKNNVSADELAQVYHVENDAVDYVAGELPGKSAKIKVINAYVLTGIGKFLTSGEAKFDDESARALCQAQGVLDTTNHSKYIKEKGNVMTGSKSGGWTLTAPGLKAGAELVRGLVQG